jgi:hypothetical protein
MTTHPLSDGFEVFTYADPNVVRLFAAPVAFQFRFALRLVQRRHGNAVYGGMFDDNPSVERRPPVAPARRDALVGLHPGAKMPCPNRSLGMGRRCW